MIVDLVIFGLHAGIWAAFFLASGRHDPSSAASPTVTKPVRSAKSKLVVTLHGAAFAILYFGLFAALADRSRQPTFLSFRIAAILVLVTCAILMVWAKRSFASWRLAAELDEGHLLAMGGPFAFIRHPIYTGLDLFALGTALWMPTPLTWLGFVLMCVFGDMRARAEETLLLEGFGSDYADYARRTKRFIPGLY